MLCRKARPGGPTITDTATAPAVRRNVVRELQSKPELRRLIEAVYEVTRPGPNPHKIDFRIIEAAERAGAGLCKITSSDCGLSVTSLGTGRIYRKPLVVHDIEDINGMRYVTVEDQDREALIFRGHLMWLPLLVPPRDMSQEE